MTGTCASAMATNMTPRLDRRRVQVFQYDRDNGTRELITWRCCDKGFEHKFEVHCNNPDHSEIALLPQKRSALLKWLRVAGYVELTTPPARPT